MTKAATIAVLGLISLLAFAFGLAYSQWKQDRVNAERTVEHFEGMKALVEMHSIVHGRLPGPSFNDVLQSLNERKKWVTVQSFGPLANGMDAWREPVIYHVIDRERAVLRSKGPNKLDDNGQGDDIEVVIVLNTRPI